MYIRENKTFSKKTQSEYIKYQLVESYRSRSGPRQRVITTFVDFDMPKSAWKAVAHSFEQWTLGKVSLFEKLLPQIRAEDLCLLFCQEELGPIKQRLTPISLIQFVRACDMNSGLLFILTWTTCRARLRFHRELKRTPRTLID